MGQPAKQWSLHTQIFHVIQQKYPNHTTHITFTNLYLTLCLVTKDSTVKTNLTKTYFEQVNPHCKLDLEELAQWPLCMTLPLVMMHQLPSLLTKRLSGSGDIAQTQSGHMDRWTDRWTDGHSGSNIPAPKLSTINMPLTVKLHQISINTSCIHALPKE